MDVATDTLSHLNAEELREMVQSLRQTVSFRQATIDKLTHENALLRLLKFAAQSERFSAEPRSLLEESLDEDTQAVRDELAELNTEPIPARVKDQPKRQPLPVHLPRIDIHSPRATFDHLPLRLSDATHWGGRGREAGLPAGCLECRAPRAWQMGMCPVRDPGAGPVAAHIIHKGIPATGLLAQVLVAKFADHMPLYRQEAIFGRAGLAIPRSTLGAWVGSCGVQLQPLVAALKADILTHRVVHADETPVQMLQPGHGKTYRAYL